MKTAKKKTAKAVKKGSPASRGPKAGGIETKAQLLAALAALGGKMDKERRNAVTCALIGHSRIQTHCFGYYNCARCGEQVGDALGSVYNGAKTAVVVGHDCDICRENFKSCTWKDKVFAPAPFTREVPRPKGAK